MSWEFRRLCDCTGSLVAFCQSQSLPVPMMELRFATEADAHRFMAAFKLAVPRDLVTSMLVDGMRGPIQLNGVKIVFSYDRHGPHYLLSMLPMHHPAV